MLAQHPVEKHDIVPEPRRTMGRGFMSGAIPARVQQNSKRPNRKERRTRLALAPREIRVLARKHRTTYLFAHKGIAFVSYFTKEEWESLNDQEKILAKKQVRNALKRRRQQERA